jgi:Predicted membrane protein
MDVRTPGIVLFTVLSSMAILMMIIPFLYPYGSFIGLGGAGGDTSFADPISRAIYGLGDLFCHQEEARSFIINGSQTAFCKRDISVLFGMILGLVFLSFRKFIVLLHDKRTLILGVILLLVTFAEWGVEHIFSIDVESARIITGIISGTGAALIIQYFVVREYRAVMS